METQDVSDGRRRDRVFTPLREWLAEPDDWSDVSEEARELHEREVDLDGCWRFDESTGLWEVDHEALAEADKPLPASELWREAFADPPRVTEAVQAIRTGSVVSLFRTEQSVEAARKRSEELGRELNGHDLVRLAFDGLLDEPPFRIAVYSARELGDLPPPAEDSNLVGPFLRRGRITLLGGPTGHGKTTFGAQMLAAAVLGGEDFLGYEVEGGLRVLIVDLEQHLEDIQEQLAAVGLDDSDLLDYAPIPEGLQIDKDQEHRDELERIVSAKPYDVVRIDPFYKLHAGDSSDEEQARALVRLTRGWVNEHDFALLMDTHVRKRLEGNGDFKLDDLFGSSLFSRDPEVILGLRMLSDGFSRLHVFKARGRGELRTGQKIDLLYSDDELFRKKPPEPELDVRAALLEHCDGVYRTLKEWRELTGGREKPVREELGRLLVDRLAEYAEGADAGRRSGAKCWLILPDEPGAPELGSTWEQQAL